MDFFYYCTRGNDFVFSTANGRVCSGSQTLTMAGVVPPTVPYSPLNFPWECKAASQSQSVYLNQSHPSLNTVYPEFITNFRPVVLVAPAFLFFGEASSLGYSQVAVSRESCRGRGGTPVGGKGWSATGGCCCCVAPSTARFSLLHGKETCVKDSLWSGLPDNCSDKKNLVDFFFVRHPP